LGLHNKNNCLKILLNLAKHTYLRILQHLKTEKLVASDTRNKICKKTVKSNSKEEIISYDIRKLSKIMILENVKNHDVTIWVSTKAFSALRHEK
jgi:hypothetical protein